MGKIIYCSDLVLRIDESEEVQNITEWLMESTEYRPVNPEGCVLRDEMTTIGKLSVILVVWIALIILTTFYCYFCEQRLFPNKNSLHQGEFCELSESSCSIDETLSATGAGHLHNNMVASLPKNDKRSRKERLASTCSCNSIASSSITGSVGPYRRLKNEF